VQQIKQQINLRRILARCFLPGRRSTKPAKSDFRLFLLVLRFLRTNNINKISNEITYKCQLGFAQLNQPKQSGEQSLLRVRFARAVAAVAEKGKKYRLKLK
jgi:hypothetical protein